MTDRKKAREILRDMLNYYYENIGKESKYGRELITPRLIQTLMIRYLELGGKLPLGENEIDREKGERL